MDGDSTGITALRQRRLLIMYKNLKITPIKNILHLEASSQYELASMFMRVQEFYESPLPGIRENFFTLEQYMDAYAKEYGNFTYMVDWNGFNVPGHVVNNFFHTFKDDLLDKEKILQAGIENAVTGMDKFYLIGTHSDKDYSEHEIAHALWYLDEDYSADALDVMSYIDPTTVKKMSDWLLNEGYTKHVILDETNAYFSTDTPRELAERLESEELPWNQIMPLHFLFHKYKERYFNENPS